MWVSADVFGMTLYVKDDVGIGQKFEKVAAAVDIVCPMIYPSHYYAGSYNIANPNAEPYKMVTYAMKDATRVMNGTGAIARPWLQDFSLGGVTYGVNEVRAQIKAVEEQGILGVDPLGSQQHLHGGGAAAEDRAEAARLVAMASGAVAVRAERPAIAPALGSDQEVPDERHLSAIGEVHAVDALLPDLVRQLRLVDLAEAQLARRSRGRTSGRRRALDAEGDRIVDGRGHELRADTVPLCAFGHGEGTHFGQVLPRDVQGHAPHDLTAVERNRVVAQVLVQRVQRARQHQSRRRIAS